MITPTTEVNIWTFDGTTKAIKLMILTMWAHALPSEVKGYQVSGTPIEPIVRKFLGCPDDYPLNMISDHITDSLDSIQSQLEV